MVRIFKTRDQYGIGASSRQRTDVPPIQLGDFINSIPELHISSTEEQFSVSSNHRFNNTNKRNSSAGVLTISSPIKSGPLFSNLPRQRYTPYYSRSLSSSSSSSNKVLKNNNVQSLLVPASSSSASSLLSSSHLNSTSDSGFSSISHDQDQFSTNASLNLSNISIGNNSSTNGTNNANSHNVIDTTVTLQISNIDTSIDDGALKNFLIGKLKPISPIVSFTFEGQNMAKIRLPSHHHAKQVVAYLHRKKIGHKRIIVSYTRDSSSMEPSMLRCQVAALLKVFFKNFFLFCFIFV